MNHRYGSATSQEVLQRLESAEFGVVNDPDVKIALDTGSAWVVSRLHERRGRLEGVAVQQYDGADVLLARWSAKPGDNQIRRIWMWDEPADVRLFFEVDPQLFVTEDVARAFLRTIVRPLREPNGVAIEPAFRFDFKPGGDGLVGAGEILDPWYFSRPLFNEKIISALMSGGRAFLILRFNRIGPTLAERFPPLSTRVRQWEKEKLMAELMRPYSNYDYRKVYAYELLARGLSSAEFETLIDAHKNHYVMGYSIVEAGLLQGYKADIEAAIARYEKLPDVNGRLKPRPGQTSDSRLKELLGALPATDKVDFTPTMLRLIRADHETEWAFIYLSNRAMHVPNFATAELAAELEAIPVKARYATKKREMVRDIRHRAGFNASRQ